MSLLNGMDFTKQCHNSKWRSLVDYNTTHINVQNRRYIKIMHLVTVEEIFVKSMTVGYVEDEKREST